MLKTLASQGGIPPKKYADGSCTYYKCFTFSQNPAHVSVIYWQKATGTYRNVGEHESRRCKGAVPWWLFFASFKSGFVYYSLLQLWYADPAKLARNHMNQTRLIVTAIFIVAFLKFGTAIGNDGGTMSRGTCKPLFMHVAKMFWVVPNKNYWYYSRMSVVISFEHIDEFIDGQDRLSLGVRLSSRNTRTGHSAISSARSWMVGTKRQGIVITVCNSRNRRRTRSGLNLSQRRAEANINKKLPTVSNAL